MQNNHRRASKTPAQVHETGVELQRSARQAERTAESLIGTAGALLRDAGYAVLGVGDVLARTLRAAPGFARRLPERLGGTMSSAGRGIGDGLDHLCERGQIVAAQVRHDRDVRSALRRTQTARSSARRAVRNVRRAARAQVRGAERSAAALGRRERRRYQAMAVDELRDLAARRQIDGRSGMDKRELIAALRR